MRFCLRNLTLFVLDWFRIEADVLMLKSSIAPLSIFPAGSQALFSCSHPVHFTR